MGALNFGVLDALDIIIAAFLLYQIYRLLKGTAAIRILLGMVAIYLLYRLVQLLEMRLLSEFLGSFMGAGLIILIIVFQQEIRKFLLVVGSATFTRRQGLRNLLKLSTEDESAKADVDAMVSAMVELAATKTGALLVIKRTDPLGSFASSGSPMNADLSKILLESIFFKNAPCTMEQPSLKAVPSLRPGRTPLGAQRATRPLRPQTPRSSGYFRKNRCVGGNR